MGLLCVAVRVWERERERLLLAKKLRDGRQLLWWLGRVDSVGVWLGDLCRRY